MVRIGLPRHRGYAGEGVGRFLRPERAVVQQTLDRIGNVLRIVWIDEQAVVQLVENVDRATDARGDDRHAMGRGFHEGQAIGLYLRRIDEDAAALSCEREQRLHILARVARRVSDAPV